MAKTAEARSKIGALDLGSASKNVSISPAIKSLVDELIVPYLVEEFLRLYGPAAAAKSNDRTPELTQTSELNSTP